MLCNLNSIKANRDQMGELYGLKIGREGTQCPCIPLILTPKCHYYVIWHGRKQTVSTISINRHQGAVTLVAEVNG